MNLLRLSAVMVGCFALVAVAAAADEKAVDKDKLIGAWKLAKSGGKAATENVVIEYTKDGKLKIVMTAPPGLAKGGKKAAAQTFTVEGTYKVEKDKITVALKQGGREQKGTATVKTLTDKKLVMVDEKGKEDEFEKQEKK